MWLLLSSILYSHTYIIMQLPVSCQSLADDCGKRCQQHKGNAIELTKPPFCRRRHWMRFINGFMPSLLRVESAPAPAAAAGAQTWRAFSFGFFAFGCPVIGCLLHLHLILSIMLHFCHCLTKMKIQCHKACVCVSPHGINSRQRSEREREGEIKRESETGKLLLSSACWQFAMLYCQASSWPAAAAAQAAGVCGNYGNFSSHFSLVVVVVVAGSSWGTAGFENVIKWL